MKPKIARFKEIAAVYDGNVSKIADALGVKRNSFFRRTRGFIFFVYDD